MTEQASRPIDLPAEVADAVYTGRARDGRAIAFVREGQLFVVAQDQGIVFALEPAHGDTPPLVLAIAEELVSDLPEARGDSGAMTPATITLASMTLPE